MNRLTAQQSWPRTARLHASLWFALTLVLSGCSQSGEIRPPGDASAAREALSTVLQTWKEGRDAKSLQSGDPVYWVADEDWTAGKTLTDFRIGEKIEQHGGHWRICAELTLSASDGPARTETFCYAVTLSDAISIIRSDFRY